MRAITPKAGNGLWLFLNVTSVLLIVATSIGCGSPLSPTAPSSSPASAPAVDSFAADAGLVAAASVAAPQAVDAGCLSVGQPVQPLAEGGTFSISIVAKCAWSVSSDESFLSPASQAKRWSGTDAVTYTLAPNPSFTARTAHLIINGGANTVRLTLTQPGKTRPCIYELSPSTQAAGFSGGQFSTSLTSICGWTSVSDQPFLIISSASAGSGDATINYSVLANASPAARIAHITVSGTGGSVELTMTQAAFSTACTYSLAPTTQLAAQKSDEYSAMLQSGCAWTASSNQLWLTVGSPSGSGNATLVYTTAALVGSVARTGTITVTGAGGSATLTVRQVPPAIVNFVANPNPVPWDGTPIPVPVCQNISNTWFYDERLTDTSGLGVRLTKRTDRLNGAFLQEFTINFNVPANGTFTNPANWCFTANTDETIQTTFTGVDGVGNPVTVSGPNVVLLAGDDGTFAKRSVRR